MDLNRFKKLKILLEERKLKLKQFYKTQEFNNVLADIKKQLKSKDVIYLEAQQIGTEEEHVLDSIFLMERQNAFKTYHHKIPTFHIFYEELVISKFYQETISYSVELKNNYLLKRGAISESSFN